MSGSGAGYIQLASIGAQDVYLTGEPKITYFSGVYKRHTPFVLEAYDIPFNDETLVFGGKGICRIPPKGDLIRSLTLKINLPPLYNPGVDWSWPQPPSRTNFPTLWFGLADGTTTGAISASSQYSYYSTNTASLVLWSRPFKKYVNYNSLTNKFNFYNVTSVIVQSTFESTQAGSGVFWGLDPINYSSIDQYGNLVYTSTTSPLVPSLSLEQSGWIQAEGLPSDPHSGMYLYLNQNLSIQGDSPQFINFKSTSPTGLQWTPVELINSRYQVSPGGCIQILQSTYYVLRMGFNLGAGSVVSISYGTSTTDGQPAIPVFLGSYNYTVSPDPSTPAVIPLVVSDQALYYYFYVTISSGGTQAQLGTYLTISLANEIYQLANDIPASNQLTLYSNVLPVLGGTIIMSPDSTIKFYDPGEFLITGSLSVSNTLTESYVTNVSMCEGANVIYTYDMSSQGRNPTYNFSIPLVANPSRSYYLSVATTQSYSKLTANSFFIINQIGTTASTVKQFVLPFNGILFRPKTYELTNPLNLATNFTSYQNSSMITVTPAGALKFANVMAFMMTAVISTSNLLSSVSIGDQTFNMDLGMTPPYTISVPFFITNNALSYSITALTTSGYLAQIYPETYISVTPLASNTLSTFLQSHSYADAVGSLSIVTADLKIGGQTIQSLSGEYIEIWNELNVPYENQPGLQLLTGKYDSLTNIPPPGRTYYVNLPFYFYGNPELSIPITALTRHDVEVWITFNNFSNLTSTAITSPVLSATIITEYVYLSGPEIDWFQTHTLDYVITQTQYQGFSLPVGFRSSVFELNFKNPVKELFFILKKIENAEYDYSSNGLKSIGLTFNGEDVLTENTTDATYLGYIEPFNHHVNFRSLDQNGIPGRQIYMYAFSTNPTGSRPSGQINFSRIRQALLRMSTFDASGYYPAKDFRVIASSQNVLRIENGIAGIMFS